MKHLLDKGGALGALIAATAVPCCFPLLAPIGVALGFGALLPFAEYALYGVMVCAVVAMVGSVVAFRSHRYLVWLLLSVGSGLLVIAALRLPWPPSVAYAGLLGLAGAAVANHVLVRRASCTAMQRWEGVERHPNATTEAIKTHQGHQSANDLHVLLGGQTGGHEFREPLP